MEHLVLELRKMVQAFQSNIDTYKSPEKHYNEQMTRQQYLDRLLSMLGWDVTNSQNRPFHEREVVVEEFSIKGDRPDYTIRVNNRSIFFLEAKKVSVDILNDKSAALQSRRYGWNKGHRISVLSNFEYLVIYSTFKKPEPVDTAATDRYRVYHYSEYVDKFEEIYTLLSRDSVLDGTFDVWTKSIEPDNATKLSLDTVFLNQLNEWRLTIAQELYKNKIRVFDGVRDLNEKVQLFINQLIFLRFAEDNRFESRDQLKKQLLGHEDYKVYFKELDKKYNAGIFDNPDVIEIISEETLAHIVESLYFPNSSYDFSIIDLSILSRIYENFLQQELVVSDSDELELQKTRSASIKSVVSTPIDVVKFMVREAILPKINGRTPEEISNLKIGDLAVGSGIFLIESYNLIEEYLTDWYSKKDNVAPSQYVVPFEEKRQIIQNVLRGYDINNLAVQLTRFSLLLRLLSYEDLDRIKDISPILPSLENTIICGNSLVNRTDIKGYDLLKWEEAAEIMAMPDDDGFREKYFDIIIGNPPYLKTEEIIQATSSKELKVYPKLYKSAYKQYDKYFLFIERSLASLKEDGVAELLVPNKFFTLRSGLRLREIIKNSKALSKIIDFKNLQIFHNVTNYVAIITLSDFSNEQFLYAKANSLRDVYQNHLEFQEYSIDQLLDSHWFLTDNSLLKRQFEFAMTHFPNIRDIVSPVNGIQTSANGVFLIKKKNIVSDKNGLVEFKVKGDVTYKIEKSILRDFYKNNPKIKGKSYSSLTSDTYVIFPYVDGELIRYDEMKRIYPNALKYFEAHKDIIMPKSMGGKNRDVQNAHEFYQYGRSQFLNESDAHKIIVGVMSSEPNFNIDRSGLLFASGGTAGEIALIGKDEAEYDLEYVQAWLSHPFTDSIFKVVGSAFEGDFYTHGTDMYDVIPLLPIDFNDEEDVQHYQQIVEYVNRIETINSELNSKNKLKKKHLQHSKIQLVKNINDSLDLLLEKKVKIDAENE